MKKSYNLREIISYDQFISEKKDPCWTGYKQIGTKKKGNKIVPNCVRIKESLIMDTDKWNATDDEHSLRSKQYVVFDLQNIKPL